MKKSRFSEKQIAFILKQGDDGTSVEEVCRKAGISQQTYYRWRKKYAGLMPSEVRRLKQLEEENARLRAAQTNRAIDGVKINTDHIAAQQSMVLCIGRGVENLTLRIYEFCQRVIQYLD